MILTNSTELSNCEMVYRSGNPLLRRTWLFYQKETMDLKLVKAFFDFVQTVDFSAL